MQVWWTNRRAKQRKTNTILLSIHVSSPLKRDKSQTKVTSIESKIQQVELNCTVITGKVDGWQMNFFQTYINKSNLLFLEVVDLLFHLWDFSVHLLHPLEKLIFRHQIRGILCNYFLFLTLAFRTYQNNFWINNIPFTLCKDNMPSKSPPYEITCKRKAKKMRS